MDSGDIRPMVKVRGLEILSSNYKCLTGHIVGEEVEICVRHVMVPFINLQYLLTKTCQSTCMHRSIPHIYTFSEITFTAVFYLHVGYLLMDIVPLKDQQNHRIWPILLRPYTSYPSNQSPRNDVVA